jgi:Tfp pilus assembly protein PilN
MIEINLLPEELRNRVIKQPKAPVAESSIKPGLNHALLLVPVIFGLLIIVHILFLFLSILRSRESALLKSRWEQSAPQRKAIEDFKIEYSLTSGDTQGLQQLLNSRICWADKLNKISALLPSGVWVEYISVTEKEFQLHGKAVSLNKEEVSLIRQFLDALKNDASFYKDFLSLELSAVQNGLVGGIEVADFGLSGVFKAR